MWTLLKVFYGFLSVDQWLLFEIMNLLSIKSSRQDCSRIPLNRSALYNSRFFISQIQIVFNTPYRQLAHFLQILKDKAC
jgi:hypothetical protein